MNDVVTVEFLRHRLRAIAAVKAKEALSTQDGGPPEGPAVSEDRIGRLEGAVEGLRHSQNLTVGIVAIFAAIVIALGVYTLQKIDQVSDRVGDLPGKISGEMRDLTKTLADTITAARQPPPPLPSVQQAPSAPAPTSPPAPSDDKH